MRLRFLACLLVVSLAVGFKAQSTPPSSQLNHRIEVLVRSQFNLPPDYEMSIGARHPSQFTGYDTLPLTFMHGGKSMNVEFLISADNTKLVHLDTLDLTQNPADAIPIAGRPIRGNANAKVTVVNFDDLECPYCARMHETIFPATLDHYKNLVKFVYKDVPLTEMHPWALHAAVDANCLAEQNSEIYWSFVDYVHAHGQEISGESRDPVKSFAALDRIAKQEGALGKLDEKRLDACISKQDATKVEAAATEARKQLNIDGTPVLFVNGERITGLVPQEQLWLVIDRALRAEGIQPPPSARPAAPAPAAANTVK